VNETKGDNYNVACPHCGKVNHSVCWGHRIEFNKISCFQKTCTHCGKVVWYHAEWAIELTAYSEDPLAQAKKPQ